MPKNAIGYRHLLPLSEIMLSYRGRQSRIAEGLGKVQYACRKIRIRIFCMLDVPEDQLLQVAGPEISVAIIRVRNDDIFVQPGYDGVYGKLDLKKPAPVKKTAGFGLEQFV